MAECSEEEKDKHMDYYPQKISEAEPKEVNMEETNHGKFNKSGA